MVHYKYTEWFAPVKQMCMNEQLCRNEPLCRNEAFDWMHWQTAWLIDAYLSTDCWTLRIIEFDLTIRPIAPLYGKPILNLSTEALSEVFTVCMLVPFLWLITCKSPYLCVLWENRSSCTVIKMSRQKLLNVLYLERKIWQICWEYWNYQSVCVMIRINSLKYLYTFILMSDTFNFVLVNILWTFLIFLIYIFLEISKYEKLRYSVLLDFE